MPASPGPRRGARTAPRHRRGGVFRRVAEQPLHRRLPLTLRDYARRVWDNSAEDNIFFLAGGISFDILLAIVPFTLLLVTALAYFLEESTAGAAEPILAFLDRFLPGTTQSGDSPVRTLLRDIIDATGSVGLFSAISFVWFSTRLFGSLRNVIANVFDIESDRGIVEGKIFDVKVTVVSTILIIAWTAISAVLAVTTQTGTQWLASVGIAADAMGRVEYWIGRATQFVLIAVVFYGLYRYLPKRRVRWETALVAAVFAGVLLEIARYLFGIYVRYSFQAASFYTGTIAALVSVVFWVYYSALIFILGGEVAQVFELRRVRDEHREAFE